MPSRRRHHVSRGACAGPLPGALAVPGRHREPCRRRDSCLRPRSAARAPAYNGKPVNTGAKTSCQRNLGPSPASGSRDPVPLSPSPPVRVDGRGQRQQARQSARDQDDPAPTHGRSDPSREGTSLHLAACGTVTDLMFTAAIYHPPHHRNPASSNRRPGVGSPPRFVILPHRRNAHTAADLGVLAPRLLPSRPSLRIIPCRGMRG